MSSRSVLLFVLSVGAAAYAGRAFASRPAEAAAASTDTLEARAALADEILALEKAEPTHPRRINFKSERLFPRLTSGVGELPPVTATVALEATDAKGQVSRVERSFLRADDAVILDDPVAGWTWVFTRNSVRPDYVQGVVLHRDARLALDYTHTDLEVEGVTTGWAGIAHLGVSVEHLALFEVDPERAREAFGATFDCYVAADPESPTRTLWWNGELGLPLRIEGAGAAGGSWSLEVTDLDGGASDPRFTDALHGLEGVHRVDVIDYREENHLTVDGDPNAACCAPLAVRPGVRAGGMFGGLSR